MENSCLQSIATEQQQYSLYDKQGAICVMSDIDLNDSHERLKTSTHYIIGLIYFATGFIGIAGNGILLHHLKKKSFLPYPRRILHISLAVANACIVAGFPLTGVSCFAERWVFGTLGCQFYGFFGMCVGLASLFHILAIALDNYFRTKDLVQGSHTKEFSRRRYIAICVLAWLFAAFWASMPLLGWAGYALEPGRHSCTLNWKKVDAYYISYLLTVTLVCYAVPFAIMFVCLWKCYRSHWVDPNSAQVQQEKLVTKLVTLLATLAVFTWTPYALLCMNSLIHDPKNVPIVTSALPPLMAKVVTCFVPLVYFVMLKDNNFA